MLRQPAVAGQFYPGDPVRLAADLEMLVPAGRERRQVTGIIAPHAGYVYSGAIAGALYGEIAVPRYVVVLCPNHHGVGARAALYPEGGWLTPLGRVPVSLPLAELVRQQVPEAEVDSTAHLREHSLEVQLPFLQHVRPEVEIVPLCLGSGDFSFCRAVGLGLARAIRAFGDEVLMVASSDMSHYETAEQAREKDGQAIAALLALDPEGLLAVCRQQRITMCGVIPAAVLLVAARELGASGAELVRYGTSGDVTGDGRQVVGYAALTVS